MRQLGHGWAIQESGKVWRSNTSLAWGMVQTAGQGLEKVQDLNIAQLLLGVAALASFAAGAQQPQSTASLFNANATTVNGVAPGYWPTAGSGLTVNLSAGTANCAGTVVTYAGGTLTMTASTTNYIYLNTASSCVPAVKTTAFTSSDIPIATIVAGSSTITSIADDRTMFQKPGSSGGGATSSAICPSLPEKKLKLPFSTT